MLHANRLGMDHGQSVMVGLLAHIDEAAALLAEIDRGPEVMSVADFILRFEKAAPAFLRENEPELQALIEPACERIALAIGAIKPKEST